jgi:MFS family permease
MSARTRPWGTDLGRDFALFWSGQTVSLTGSRVTNVALPLTAILVLHASPLQVGLVGAFRAAATLVCGLFAGLWVDRAPRRTTMIVANVGPGLALATVPLAAGTGHLTLSLLYGAGFVSSALGFLFDTAANASVPLLVPAALLVRANAARRVGSAGSGIVGPGLGGALVQLLSAPGAILADVLSFGISAVTLLAVRMPEVPRPRGDGTSLRRELTEGLRIVLANPLLRSLTGVTATYTLFDSMLFGVYILFMNRTLHFSAATIGVVFSLAAVLGLAGALLAPGMTRRIGIGRALVVGIAILVGGEVLIAGARGPVVVAATVLVVAEGAVELGAALFGINAGSIQQAITPDALRGRVGAASDLLSYGIEPLGLVLGGALGGVIGLRETVVVSVIGTALSLLWFIRSPVPRLRELPEGLE